MAKSSPPSRNSTRPGDLYGREGPVPAPQAHERNTETAWDLWHTLAAQQDVHFADTAPASMPMPLPKGDRRYAPTVPSALTAQPSGPTAPVRAPAGKTVTIGDVMVEARRNNRLCPQPLAWQRLYEMLPEKTMGQQGWQPPPPLTGSAWSGTPSLAKRMCLRDHIEWAEAHGCLDAVHAYLKDLPEDQWHHMGD